MKHAGEKIHKRDIIIDSYEAGPDMMVFTATLQEKRLADYYLSTGEKQPAGDLHHMTVRLLVRVPDMLIEDIEAEMHTVPRDECHDILSAFQAVKGMSIQQGFTGKLKEKLGGVKGCTHMLHLLTTLAPAAMQGMWAGRSRQRSTGLNLRRLLSMKKILIDSCYAWREGGTAGNKLTAAIDEAGKTVESEK